MTSDKPSASENAPPTERDAPGPVDEDSVIVTTAPDVARAEMIAAVLRAEGIPASVPFCNVAAWYPHWTFTRKHGGIPVVIPADLIDEANEILGRKTSETDEHDRPANRTDELARRAFQAAMYSLFFPPILPWALWRIARAWRACHPCPPQRPNAFYAYLFFAVALACILLTFAWLLLRGFPG
jgi:hypothetical protein